MNQVTDFIAERAFPTLAVDQPSGSYYTYDASYWFTDEMARRAPGGAYAGSGYELSTASFTTEQFALEHVIPDEVIRAADAPLQPEQDAVAWLQNKRLIHIERQFSSDFMKTSVWGTDNTSATDWDDATNGVPITNVQVALRTIKNATGQTADTLVMGWIVRDGLVLNTQIVDKIKYVERALPGDLDAALPAALGVRRLLVSKATYETAAEGVTSSMAAILDDDALLILAPDSIGPRTATSGATISWDGGGGMGMFDRIRRDDVDADVARIKAQWVQKLVGNTLGYFWSDIV